VITTHTGLTAKPQHNRPFFRSGIDAKGRPPEISRPPIRRSGTSRTSILGRVGNTMPPRHRPPAGADLEAGACTDLWKFAFYKRLVASTHPVNAGASHARHPRDPLSSPNLAHSRPCSTHSHRTAAPLTTSEWLPRRSCLAPARSECDPTLWRDIGATAENLRLNGCTENERQSLPLTSG